MKGVYISGPMTWKPYFNFYAFCKAEEMLRSTGYKTVFNPVRFDVAVYGLGMFMDNPTGDPVRAREDYGFDIRQTAAADLAFIASHAHSIALLDGWENSRGALAEKAVADWLQLEIIYL